MSCCEEIAAIQWLKLRIDKKNGPVGGKLVKVHFVLGQNQRSGGSTCLGKSDFTGKSSFGSRIVRFMSCQKLNQQAEGGGGSVQNDAMETEEDRWSLGDEEESDMGEGSRRYKKHNWTLVYEWMNIGIEEAYLRSKKILTADFNVAEGIAFKQWPTPCEKKVGPFAGKLVSQ